MLVKTLKHDESLVIEVEGKKVQVKVISIRGNRVRLGTVAPREAPIRHLDERGFETQKSAEENARRANAS